MPNTTDHTVMTENKATTRLRIIFDASAHEDGCPSLNDRLFTRLNLNQDLLNILVKFRLHPTSFMDEIKKAFLQISIAEEDRYVLMFLWLTGHPDAENTKLGVLRMTHMVFCVLSSLFLLTATTRNHPEKYQTSN